MKNSIIILFCATLTINYSSCFPSNNIEIDKRIVGGEEIPPNEFKFAVALRPTKPEGIGLCGGSIISEDWILTSSFCLERATSVEAILGAHDITEDEPSQVVIEIPAENIIKHPDYDSSNANFDIGLIKTVEPIIFNEFIGAIALPNLFDENQFTNTLGISLGWGRGSENRLHGSANIVISNAACTATFGNVFIIPSSICVSTVTRSGPCTNDQGGPLFTFDTQKLEEVLIGIISWPTCGSGSPDIYTRVTALREWIQMESGI